MRISLAIPTRERAELLGPCLDAALAVEDPDFEIVVSDNASQDATAEVLAARCDPRLKVVSTDARVSMRSNFENALTATSGDYVVFIGDDDGVLASGIAMLRDVLEAYGPDAVGWPLLGYTWPSRRPGHQAGFVNVQRKSVYGGIRFEPPKKALERALAGRIRNYKDLANIYHGCISRKLIDRVRSRTNGTYFAGAVPDVYSSIANLMEMQTNLCWVDHPVTFGGASDRSNGAAQCGAAKATKEGAAEVRAFVAEGTLDIGASGIDLTVPSVDALTLDMLEIATKDTSLFGQIDHDAWFSKIQRRLSNMPKAKAQHGTEILWQWATERGLGGLYRQAVNRYPAVGPTHEPEGRRKSDPSFGLRMITLASEVNMTTVADGARMLEATLGPHDPSRPGGLFRWFRAIARARAEVRRWG
ncbi:MAG: glycosyltransferase family 2 protein [Pseudomonadota bacterium]